MSVSIFLNAVFIYFFGGQINLFLFICIFSGQPLIQVRSDSFDSQLVESGPPPLELENGNYLFFYNSAMLSKWCLILNLISYFWYISEILLPPLTINPISIN